MPTHRRRSLAAIKKDLVRAHRTKNWPLAKLLSQEKALETRNRPRTHNKCPVCGKSTHGHRCSMHGNLHRFYKSKLPIKL